MHSLSPLFTLQPPPAIDSQPMISIDVCVCVFLFEVLSNKKFDVGTISSFFFLNDTDVIDVGTIQSTRIVIYDVGTIQSTRIVILTLSGDFIYKHKVYDLLILLIII